MARKPLDQLSPAYRKRIERAQAQGKTRQQARGHKPREHVLRAQRERTARGGLTAREIELILKWALSYANDEKRPVMSLIEEAQQRGYVWFQDYRKGWDAVRRQYLRERKAGTWASRGLGFLESLAGQWELPDISWAYYH